MTNKTYSINAFYGDYRIIFNEYLLEDGPPEQIKRTWKERLFSWPWNPLKKTKTIIPKIPSKKIYFLEKENIFLIHPEYKKILDKINH